MIQESLTLIQLDDLETAVINNDFIQKEHLLAALRMARKQRSAASEKQAQDTVTIPAELASLIAKVFLPKNPNKMRGADPSVVKAAHEFKTYAAGQKPWSPNG